MAMTKPVVVDASVGVKWVVDEELYEPARALLLEASAQRRALYCPPHFTGEAVNAIYQKLRSRDAAKHLPLAEAQAAIIQFVAAVQVGVSMVSPPELYEYAFDFAQMHQLQFIYDSIYVVLARNLQGELWTADRRLLNIVGRAAPWVRWIGDYPLPQ